MQDKEIMENLLLNLKGECDLLMHGAIESSTPDVHSAFTTAFCETLALQNQLYAKMAEKGWYPTTPQSRSRLARLNKNTPQAADAFSKKATSVASCRR